MLSHVFKWPFLIPNKQDITERVKLKDTCFLGCHENIFGHYYVPGGVVIVFNFFFYSLTNSSSESVHELFLKTLSDSPHQYLRLTSICDCSPHFKSHPKPQNVPGSIQAECKTTAGADNQSCQPHYSVEAAFNLCNLFFF